MLALMLLGGVIAGCGSTDATQTAANEPDDTATEQPAASTAEPATEPPAEPPAAPAGAQPAQAPSVRVRVAALVDAYAPVTSGVYAIEAANILRDDAEQAGVRAETYLARLRTEQARVREYQQVLKQAAPAVRGAQVQTPLELAVQSRLLRAIEARGEALTSLEQVLGQRTSADGSGGDTTRGATLEEQWESSWNEAYRHAREATTLLQHEYSRLDLEPLTEDAIR